VSKESTTYHTINAKLKNFLKRLLVSFAETICQVKELIQIHRLDGSSRVFPGWVMLVVLFANLFISTLTSRP